MASRSQVNPPRSSISRAPARNAARARRESDPPTLMRLTPASASCPSVIDGSMKLATTLTGRVTDAYTNIATVKLFAHGRREAGYAKEAMQEFMLTAYGQMRLVTGFEIVNTLLSALLVGATVLLALWLWGLSLIGVGAVAAATAMAMRLNGISHWVMWEMAALFENIGTVQDGIATLTHVPKVQDAPNAATLQVTQGEVQFDDVYFNYNNERQVLDGLTLTVRPGDLLHADLHGVVVVPFEIADEIPAVADKIFQVEAEIMSLAKKPDFKAADLRALY